MKTTTIELTNKEIKTLIRVLSVGNFVINGNLLIPDQDKNINNLVQKIFKTAFENGLKKEIEEYEGEYTETEKYLEKTTFLDLEDYEQGNFEDRLIELTFYRAFQKIHGIKKSKVSYYDLIQKDPELYDKIIKAFSKDGIAVVKEIIF